MVVKKNNFEERSIVKSFCRINYIFRQISLYTFGIVKKVAYSFATSIITFVSTNWVLFHKAKDIIIRRGWQVSSKNCSANLKCHINSVTINVNLGIRRSITRDKRACKTPFYMRGFETIRVNDECVNDALARYDYPLTKQWYIDSNKSIIRFL